MAKFPSLSAEQLNSTLSLQPIEVDIEELQASIKVKPFSLNGRDSIMAKAKGADDKLDANKLLRLLVVHGVVEPQFSMEQVGEMDFHVVESIAAEVMRINGLQKEKGPSAATVAAVTF